jgi:hypothetical protein
MQIVLNQQAKEIFNSPKVRFYAKFRKRYGGVVLTLRPLYSNTKTEDQANVIDGTIKIPDQFVHINQLEFKNSFYSIKPTSSGQYSLIGVDEPENNTAFVQVYL